MLISEANLWPCRTQYKWDGYVSVWRTENGKLGVLYVRCKFSIKNRRVISGKMLLYLIGFWKTDGKSWWKNLTALLAEICQPGPAQITLDEEDSRACEGGSSREREWEREKWDSDKSHIPAHNFIPKPLSVFPGTIRHKGSIKTLAWDFQSLLACL